MIHVIRKSIQNHTWGETWGWETELPGVVKSIKGFWVNVVPQPGAKLRVSRHEEGEVNDVRVGMATLAVDGATVITSGTPALVMGRMRCGGRRNRVRMSETAIVRNGATLRITMEETNKSPFVNEADDGKSGVEAYFASDESVGNGYELKVYIDYD